MQTENTIYVSVTEDKYRRYIAISNLSYDSEDWEKNHFLVLEPVNNIGSLQIVLNVLRKCGAHVIQE